MEVTKFTELILTQLTVEGGKGSGIPVVQTECGGDLLGFYWEHGTQQTHLIIRDILVS